LGIPSPKKNVCFFGKRLQQKGPFLSVALAHIWTCDVFETGFCGRWSQSYFIHGPLWYYFGVIGAFSLIL